MKKLTFLMIALVACAFAMSADELEKPDVRSSIYNYEDIAGVFERVGETSIFYDIAYRSAVGPGYQYGISILGEIFDDEGVPHYYSSTYQSGGPGAGFIAAFKVTDNDGRVYGAQYLDALNGTTLHNVTMTARVEAQGSVAARVVYSLKNNNPDPVTISAGIWGDIMIGTNDRAPLSELLDENGKAYGIRMKASNDDDAPMLCMLFGGGVTGVEAADKYWFGRYSTNYYASEIVGAYNEGSNWMEQNGTYDSGLGFCWEDRTIQPGESIDLSYLVSVGEVEFDPVTPPGPEGQDIFTANVRAINFEGWNDLSLLVPGWTNYHKRLQYQSYPVTLTRGVNELRFTLGMGNYTDIPGLEWEDVRSFELTVSDGEHVYNGEPQQFTVTVAGLIDYNFEYTDAGDYTWGIYGDFDMETIGVNEIVMTIEKAQSEVSVGDLVDVPYDGQPHGADVTVTAGDGALTVTYIKVGTDIVLTEAPTQPGVYIVVVEVAETNNYYGYEGSFGPYEIKQNPTGVEELTISTQDNGAWYTIDGRRVAAPAAPGMYIHNGKKYVVK